MRAGGITRGARAQSWDRGDQLKRRGNIPPSFPNASTAVFFPLAASQVCKVLVPDASISAPAGPGALWPRTPAAVRAAGSSLHLVSPPSPVATFPLMSPPVPEGLAVGEAAAPGAAGRGFCSPPGSAGAEPPRWAGTSPLPRPCCCSGALRCPCVLRALIIPANQRPVPQKIAPDFFPTKKKS